MLAIFHSCATKNQSSDLKSQIEEIISTKNGDFGISIISENPDESIGINENKDYPLLSTVKFPLALKVLNEVEIGNLTMHQKILIKKEDLLENTYSPFRKENPEGNIAISIEEALNWMLLYSDNNITDVLIRQLGGPKNIENFMANYHFKIVGNEEDMHKDWNAQFINTATPQSYSQLLKDFAEGKILNEENTHWLYNAMLDSKTGLNRLKGKLPKVAIAQRSGTSFTNEEGITGAINNVGIMELPNNKKIYISVFIHNTSEDFATGEEIIADIGKATYEYYK